VTEDRADRELLFEALALHLGFLPHATIRERVASARAQTSAREPRPPGELLSEGSHVTAQQTAVLETLVDTLMERHGRDVRRCLDALSGFSRLRNELERRRGGSDQAPRTDALSSNPTVQSVPVKRGRMPEAAESIDPLGDWSIHGEPGGSAGLAEAETADEWFLGARSSTGMRFHILRLHAQGGIGKVSVAFDNELHREVALKQIKPERADDTDSRSRFVREAEVTGGLEHPGIVPVYGLGMDDDGRPFYAMRFVRGMSFDEAIAKFHQANEDPHHDPRERTLSLRQLLQRFADVCQTIAYAHSRGVLHRDLKPANILLGPFNESLVVDWGLAKRFDLATGEHPEPIVSAAPGSQAEQVSDRGTRRPRAQRDGDQDHPPESTFADAGREGDAPAGAPPISLSSSIETAAGATFGTPAYMSPEQAEGRTDELGPQSDVYSLGAMLYTLLSGRTPFEYVWCDVTAMLDRVRSGEFPPPRQVNPRVPRALEAVCLKAMATRPQNRYASASELAQEIERWLADEPVSAYGEPIPARLARWGRRHKPVVAGAAALLLTAVAALSAGIILIGREQHKTEQQRLLAIAKSQEATQKAESLRHRDAVNRVNLAYREYLDDNVALADELLDGCPPDLRAWEWTYARKLGHSALDSWTPSSQSLDVWCLAFSPDGSRLAAGTGPWQFPNAGPTGELAVRDALTGAQVLARRNLTGAVQAVAFAPDGGSIAMANGFTGKDQGAVLTLLDIQTGRPRWQTTEHGVHILGLAFAPDGRTIATGCGIFNSLTESGFSRLRDARTGAAVGPPIPGAPGGVLSVALAPDGDQLAMASRDVVDVWNIAGGKRAIVHRLRGHVNYVYTVVFSPDGKRLATGGWDKAIRVWDAYTGQLLDTLLGHRGFVRGLAFSPDGAQLVSGSEDKSVRRWDLGRGGENASFHGHTGFIHCVAFSSDGVLACSGSLDGTVKLWPAAAPDSQVTFRNSAGWVGTLAFAPDGRRIASAHNGNVRIWDPRTGEELHRLPGRHDLLAHIGLAFSPDGGVLAASSADGISVNIWDTRTWATRQVLKGHATPVSDAAFAPDGALLATAGDDGTLRLWDVAQGKSARSLSGFARGVRAVAFSPDGSHLAAAGTDQIVKVWDVATGDELVSLTGHVTTVQDVAFSPDGRTIASVGGMYHGLVPAEVKLWDWRAGRESANTFQGHTALVTAVAFIPDGRRLATASDDRTIKLWDTETGEDVLTLRGHTSGVVSLAASPDGSQLASGSIDYTARVWNIEASAGSTAFELSLRRAAVERVQSLFSKYMLKSLVMDTIRADPTLSPRLKAAALEIAERRTESAAGLYDAAWLTIIRPIGKPEENLLAVRKLEAACRIVADDRERALQYRRALALALYRTGQHAKALETLHGLPAAEGAKEALPLELAVAAMASRKLGRTRDARVELGRLRALLKTDRWANDQEASGLLREAEEVFDESLDE
jgi:WD40 repeat protein/serine/threonine protein kinase